MSPASTRSTLYTMNTYYRDQYAQYHMPPTPCNIDANIGPGHLGNHDGCNGFSMYRTASGFSHSSYESNMLSDCLSPMTVDSNFEFDNQQTISSNNGPMRPSYTITTNRSPYRFSSTQASIPRYPGGFQLIETGQMSTMQPISVQTGKPVVYACLHYDCKQKPFRRHADLVRHLKHVHRSLSSKNSPDDFYCDYKRCRRSEGAYTGHRDQRTGGNPFNRWDHYKAHLRDYHKEPIPKRGAKMNSKLFDGRTFNLTWWRCSKCLKRNYIVDIGGYKCNHCSQSLEKFVVDERQRKFPTEQTIAVRKRL